MFSWLRRCASFVTPVWLLIKVTTVLKPFGEILIHVIKGLAENKVNGMAFDSMTIASIFHVNPEGDFHLMTHHNIHQISSHPATKYSKIEPNPLSIPYKGEKGVFLVCDNKDCFLQSTQREGIVASSIPFIHPC